MTRSEGSAEPSMLLIRSRARQIHSNLPQWENHAIEVQRAAANHCELDRKACPIVDLQAGFTAMLVAGNGHQTRLRLDASSTPNPESNPRPHGRSDGGFSGCVIFSCGIGKPPNRQGTALLNQSIDLLNHGIASKTVSGVRLELARRRR